MERMGPDRASWLAAFGLAVVFGLQVFLGSSHLSLTWDEPGYVASGYVNWTEGDYRLAPDHPPLLQKLQALPLLALDVHAPPLSELEWNSNPRATYGRAFFFDSGNDPIRLARFARAPVLLMGVLLVLCVYGFARELLPREAALLACALAALDPNLIAHAELATEDLGCTALMLAAIWTFWRWLEAPGLRRASICGVVSALALLSKYTALLLLPIDLALALVFYLQRRRAVDWRSRTRDVVVMAALAAPVINFAYGFGFHLDDWVAGISQIYPDLRPGYQFYFWGQLSPQPFWFYALASLAIKTPLSVWLLLGLATATMLRSRASRRTAAVLAIPAAAMLFVSFFDITSPGVRRVLPAVPFVLMLAALALDGEPTRIVRGVAWSAVLASAATAFWIHPHQLSYINPLFGGPDNGPYVLDESNIDWGQDLPALARWQDAHLPDEAITLSYFGIADPAAYGVRFVPFDQSVLEHPGPGVKAVSAHTLVSFRKYQAASGKDVDWLSKYEPIAKAGYSIFIYSFPEEGR